MHAYIYKHISENNLTQAHAHNQPSVDCRHLIYHLQAESLQS